VSKLLSNIGNCEFSGIRSGTVFFSLLGCCYSAYVGSCLQTLRDGPSFPSSWIALNLIVGRGQFKCDGTSAETRFRLSAKRTSPFKSAWASVQSTTGSRGECISGSNAGYTMFRGSVKGLRIRSSRTARPPLDGFS